MQVPRFDIFEAIGFFTGEGFMPNSHDPSWRRLQARLDKRGSTGAEFCHWMIYYYLPQYPDHSRLIQKNLMCCDKCWFSFMEYASTSPKIIKAKIISQLADVSKHLKYGYSVDRLLLENITDLNAITKVEVAIREHNKADYNPSKVLEAYATAAWELLLGCPTYSLYSPHLMDYITQGGFDEYLRR